MDKIKSAEFQTQIRNLKFKTGFTLLEVMVAVSIIAIVLVSVYRMHAQTISMNSRVRFYATAPILAKMKMAETESKSLKDMADDSGDFGDEFPNYRWNITLEDVDSSALDTVSEDLKKIEVIVSFNNDEFIYNLRAYKFLPD